MVLFRSIRIPLIWFIILIGSGSASLNAQNLKVQGLPHISKRPNIVWIVAEDMSPDLRAFGQTQVRTPNLDKLAGKGVLFTNAFATSPLCSTSRSAFLTGTYQTTIGAHHQRLPQSLAPSLPSGIKTLPEELKKLGYFSVNAKNIVKGLSGTGKDDWNFRTTKSNQFQSSKVTEIPSHQPFFMQINFSESHRAFHSPRFADPEKVVIPPYYPDHPVSRLDFAKYLDDVTALDKKVGKVLNWLKNEGHSKNTLVMFFSDHGRPMIRGKQWCYDSGLKVPLIVYWPQGSNRPASYQAGKKDSRLVSLIDVTATTLQIAGGEIPSYYFGRLLFDQSVKERTAVYAASDRDGECRLQIRSVRMKRFHYLKNGFPNRPPIYSTAYRKANHPIYHLIKKLDKENRLNPIQKQLTIGRGPEELYDIQVDPYETNNLVNDPSYCDVLKEMREKLKNWTAKTGDLGLREDSPEIANHFLTYGKKSERQRRRKIELLKKRVYEADELFLRLKKAKGK